MTVCIAAITREGYIATISDQMISTVVHASVDSAVVKVEPIHRHWSAMMASDDLTQCIPIIERAGRYFRGRANTLQNARASFKRAYLKHLSEMAADQVLGRFNMSMESFVKSGKRQFTESQFNKLSEKIQAVRAGCQFLVYGFDEKRRPHLFVVGESGEDQVYDRPGFCVIGSGTYAAEGMLYSLGQTDFRTLPQTLFNVCAAKFTAERTPGVGADSFVFCKKFGTEMFSMPTWVVPAIRDSWEQHGRPRVPDGIIGRLEAVEFRFGEVPLTAIRESMETTFCPSSEIKS